MDRRTESHAWGVPFVLGILMIIGGLFALYASVLTSFVTVVFLGVLLLVVGALEIVAAFRVRRSGHFLMYFLAGVLSVVVGALFLDRPLATLASLTILFSGFLFATGVFHAVVAIADRHARWGWDLMYGFAAIVLGVILVAEWPFSSLWIIGTIVGVEIIVRGIALISASMVLRRIEHGELPGGLAAA